MIPSHLKTAIHHYIGSLEGWTSPERCCELCELVIDTKPEMVVEIGVFAGRTLIAQAMGCRENGRGAVHGIDPWKMDAAVEGESQANIEYWQKLDLNLFHKQTMDTVWAHHLERFCIVIRSRSEDCAHLFNSIDILNIDGCHSEVASVRDVRYYLPRVRKGGYIWADDCQWQVNGKPSTATMQQLLEVECDVVKVGDNGNYKLYRKR